MFLPILGEENCAEREEVDEAMKLRVDPDLCRACELCTETCPDIFEIGEDVATVEVDFVPSDLEECVRQAAEDCPAEAIMIEGQ